MDDGMGSLEDEGKGVQGDQIKALYYDILNSKGTKATYQDSDNEEEEKKHVKKLNKKRAKELRKQQKKLENQEKKAESDSDGELPFFMRDASIVAAQKERALEAMLAAKKKRKRKDSS